MVLATTSPSSASASTSSSSSSSSSSVEAGPRTSSSSALTRRTSSGSQLDRDRGRFMNATISPVLRLRISHPATSSEFDVELDAATATLTTLRERIAAQTGIPAEAQHLLPSRSLQLGTTTSQNNHQNNHHQNNNQVLPYQTTEELPRHPSWRFLWELGVVSGSRLTLIAAMQTGTSRSHSASLAIPTTPTLVLPELTEEQLHRLKVEKKPVEVTARVMGAMEATVQLVVQPTTIGQAMETSASYASAQTGGNQRKNKKDRDNDDENDDETTAADSEELRAEYRLRSRMRALRQDMERHRKKTHRTKSPASSSGDSDVGSFKGLRPGFLLRTPTAASEISHASAKAGTGTIARKPLLKRGFLLPASKQLQQQKQQLQQQPMQQQPQQRPVAKKEVEVISAKLEEQHIDADRQDVKKSSKPSCYVCRRKLTPAAALAGGCRCGHVFCSQHRSSSVNSSSNSNSNETGHACSYDYKKFGSKQLKQQLGV